MIHGGLRYLENREIRLVKESLAERRLFGTVTEVHALFSLPAGAEPYELTDQPVKP